MSWISDLVDAIWEKLKPAKPEPKPLMTDEEMGWVPPEDEEPVVLVEVKAGKNRLS